MHMYSNILASSLMIVSFILFSSFFKELMGMLLFFSSSIFLFCSSVKPLYSELAL